MKFLRALCLVALLVAITLPVYAETQSIKLSGDIIMRWIDRKNYDFNQWNANGVAVGTRDNNAADANYFMTTAEIQLDADLTDNVSATIRVVNQRDWNVRIWDGGDHINGYVYPSDTGHTASNDEFKIDVDLAYVTLKEFFFAPLTVKIGRQDLWYGKGFIIGANGWQDPQHQLSGDEWSVLNAFDAVRATWDASPWTLDLVYAMILENDIGANDDEQLYGANLGCDLSQYNNAEAELYYFIKNDRSLRKVAGGGASSAMKDGNTVHTIGMRGSFDPHEAITLWAEGALQVGTYYRGTTQIDERPRGAGAVDVGGEMRLWQDQYAWKPKLGAEYIYYSGEKIDEDVNNTDHRYGGWDRMYRGKVDSAIHEWYNYLYTNSINNATVNDRGDTNLHQFILMGSLQPMDNLKVSGRWIDFWLAQDAINVFGGGNRHVGNELDVELNYDYTEDVSFGLLGAWFWSGDHYISPEQYSASVVSGGSNSKSKNVATELVGTCKVTF
ncbi:MAG: alginate export family protein [Candidatus Omnitrophica bacterium]|nr:alginate export family protein [Candidatus Omnitrophota bacterium]MBU4488738.1 alginate export family protein [Candidatus Omnitrophota bacterium]MCG2705835.1 alginate export family protein [Candidatus Omnitrophota bacterium]